MVKATAPTALVEEARGHERRRRPRPRLDEAEGDTWWARAANPQTRVLLAQSFAMEWSMLWKDLLDRLRRRRAVSAFVPNERLECAVPDHGRAWIAVPVDALIGPAGGDVTFVCSVGNVPLAAILWAGGASFAGVLSFIYADLIVLPLLDTYRRYFGWRMAVYLFVVLFATMALAGLIVHLGFTAFGLTPAPDPGVRAAITRFSLNYTFVLNVIFGIWAAWLFWVNHAHPMDHAHMHHAEHHDAEDASGHAAHS